MTRSRTPPEGFFVTRTLRALEVLAFQPASAPQVAGALQVHPRTARRLLNRLVADGWLMRSDERRRVYAPTLRIVALAAQLADRDPLANAARGPVTRIHQETGLVAHLAIPSYRSVLCLVHRAGEPDVRPLLRELVPAHASASGKVLLAHREPWRDSVLRATLEPVTRHTVTDPEGVIATAEKVIERGYATEEEEHALGWRGVAVPVWDARGEVSASLALTGTTGRLSRADLPGLADALTVRAQEIHRIVTGRA
jgi:DNA-binding IclR family transcriptional regulator